MLAAGFHQRCWKFYKRTTVMKDRCKLVFVTIRCSVSSLFVIHFPSCPLTLICLQSLCSLHFLGILLISPCDVLFKCPTSFIANYILTRFWLHSSLYWILVEAWHWQKGFLELRRNFGKWQFFFRAVSLNGIFDKMVITPEILL